MIIKQLQSIYTILSLGVLMIFMHSCEDETSSVLNNDLIFPEAKEIKIPSYTYYSDTDQIYVHGDESFGSDIIDTLTSTPVLCWDSVMASQIVVGIFVQPIKVENGYISNTEDMVWIWHSGLNKGKDGKVIYTDGKKITDGNISFLSDPEPLTGSVRYYWGVWSWNASGVRITHSSRPLSFLVR